MITQHGTTNGETSLAFSPLLCLRCSVSLKFYKNIFPYEHVSRDVTCVMNPCHELVTKHLVTRWDEALTAETFFFITHCLYLLSHCFSPLTPSHRLTWCWGQCDASSVCNTLCDCLVSIKPRAWLFNSRNIVATQSVALVPGILDHPPSSCFIFIQNFFLMFYFSNICWAKGPIPVSHEPEDLGRL